MTIVPLEHKIAATGAFMDTANRLPTLFSLDDEAERLISALDVLEDPEEVAAVEAQLALVDQMMMDKTEAYISVVRSLEAMAEARKAEADRLKARAATAQRNADWLRNRLLVHMKTIGQERIETTRFTLSVRQNPLHCEVVDASAVPSMYERTTITTTIDRRSILADFKATGELIPGVRIGCTERLVVS